MLQVGLRYFQTKHSKSIKISNKGKRVFNYLSHISDNIRLEAAYSGFSVNCDAEAEAEEELISTGYKQLFFFFL